MTSGAGGSAVVSSYFVTTALDHKTVYLASPISGLGVGATFAIVYNANGPYSATGVLGGAVQLDGHDDVVPAGHVLSWWLSNPADANDTLTVFARIRPDHLTGGQQIVHKNGPFGLRLADNRAAADLYAGGIWKATTATQAVSAAAWHDLAMTYDGSALVLYVDGALAAATPASGPLAGNGCLAIGRANNGGCNGNPTNHLAGLIDDVRIYSRALQAAEVTALTPSPVRALTRAISDIAPGPHTYRAVVQLADGSTYETPQRTLIAE